MIRKQVGMRIKELRLQKGLSQEKCSFDANIDRSYLASVELGCRNISIINLQKICIALDISLKDFFNSNFFAGE